MSSARAQPWPSDADVWDAGDALGARGSPGTYSSIVAAVLVPTSIAPTIASRGLTAVRRRGPCSLSLALACSERDLCHGAGNACAPTAARPCVHLGRLSSSMHYSWCTARLIFGRAERWMRFPAAHRSEADVVRVHPTEDGTSS